MTKLCVRIPNRFSMRISFAFLLLFVISSCGVFQTCQSHLRFVKTDRGSEEIAVIEKQVQPASGTTLEAGNDNPIIPNERQTPIATIASIETEQQAVFVDTKPRIPELIQTNNDEKDDQQLIAEQAIKTEKQATASLVSAVIGLVSLLLPYLGIIPFIFGLVFYIHANNSRYITPLGEHRLKISKGFLIADSILLFLWIVLVVLIILFL